MVKISIILPIYNVSKYIHQCLDSIEKQTFTDFEVICINDGSTDNSLEILNEYAQKDKRIIVISQENQGQGVARNKGLKLAKGKYIQFIDPDDWIDFDMLKTLYNFAEKHHSQVVKFNYKEYNDYSGQYKKIDFATKIKKDYNYNLIESPFYTWRLFKSGCLYNLDCHVWAHFYLADFIKSNNIKFAPTKHGEDHLFANGALLLANKIDYLNACLYTYRIRSGSSIHIKSDINFGVFDNIKLLQGFIVEHNLFSELKEEWEKYAKQIVCSHYSLISDARIKEYEDLCLQYFNSNQEFKVFRNKFLPKRKFVEHIFSLKNEYRNAIKYKVLTIFGLKIQIKSKAKTV